MLSDALGWHIYHAFVVADWTIAALLARALIAGR